MIGQARRLALAGQEAGRHQARGHRDGEEQREERQLGAGVRAPIRAAGRRPASRTTATRGRRGCAARRNASAAPAAPGRDPGVPGRSGRHAERPVRDRRNGHPQQADATRERTHDERPERERLERRAQHHPAPVGVQVADRERRDSWNSAPASIGSAATMPDASSPSPAASTKAGTYASPRPTIALNETPSAVIARKSRRALSRRSSGWGMMAARTIPERARFRRDGGRGLGRTDVGRARRDRSGRARAAALRDAARARRSRLSAHRAPRSRARRRPGAALRDRAGARSRAAAGGAVRRRAVPDEGCRRAPAGRALLRGKPRAARRGPPGRSRHAARRALPRCRLRHRRQLEHTRVRPPVEHLAARVRADPQPLGPAPRRGRLVGWRLRRRRRRDRAGRARERRQRARSGSRRRGAAWSGSSRRAIA